MAADATSIEDLVDRGIAHHEAGRTDEARAAYMEALQIDPNHAEALSLFGLIEREERRLPAAAELLRRAMLADPTWWSYANDLGEALLQLGRLPESEAALRRAVELNGKAFQPHFLLGLVLNRMQRSAEAAVELELAVQIEPNSAEAWHSLGMALMGSQRLQESEKAQRRALELNVCFPDAEHALGMVLTMMGRPEEAINHLETAIGLRPNDVALMASFAEARFNRGEHYAAIELLERAVELDPRSFQLQWALSRAYWTVKNWARVLEVLQACLAIEPNVPIAYYLMGTAQRELGDLESCKVNMRRALDMGVTDRHAVFFANAVLGGLVPHSPEDMIADLFDKCAHTFEKQLVEDLGYQGHKMIEYAVRDVLPGEPKATLDVLDIGCGTGLVGELMKPWARRLIGNDLAPKMVEKSRERGIYDELIVGDAAAVLNQRPQSADLIVAGDVLIYIGQADEVFEATDRALRPGGMFSLTIETKEGDGMRLMPSHRYQHSLVYMRRLAKRHRWEELHCSQHVLRNEDGKGVAAHVLLFRKPKPG